MPCSLAVSHDHQRPDEARSQRECHRRDQDLAALCDWYLFDPVKRHIDESLKER